MGLSYLILSYLALMVGISGLGKRNGISSDMRHHCLLSCWMVLAIILWHEMANEMYVKLARKAYDMQCLNMLLPHLLDSALHNALESSTKIRKIYAKICLSRCEECISLWSFPQDDLHATTT
ncbi:uncharacterized protein LOC122194955 [Lactuca sativa]|uniref:uncharacterized protein LOC122194955 n=1 Tax=Lactuca sativa TaxID=4236 RepID=UPI001C68CAAE|nr:uncharacterized protein LOC122194955 [Lactuca sativa]